MTDPPTRLFQVSRREIKDGTGIGSMNTIDEAIGALEAYGLLLRYPEYGSNDGYQYELLSLDEKPMPVISARSIASVLKQLVDKLERDSSALKCEQLNQLAIITYKAQRLIS